MVMRLDFFGTTYGAWRALNVAAFQRIHDGEVSCCL